MNHTGVANVDSTLNEWNRLPGECVNATSVNMFKNKIDNYFKRSG